MTTLPLVFVQLNIYSKPIQLYHYAKINTESINIGLDPHYLMSAILD